MKKIDEVRWGIIGCGDVTEKKSGPAFDKVPHSSRVAVMRRDAQKAADYAARHQVAKWYSDAAELIRDSAVNAVYVATPPDTHAAYAIAAMRAGKPVYVEKPMARNHAECLEMLKTSEETGMPLFVAYYRRTLPAFLRVRELVGNGEIGQPLNVLVKLHLAYGERDKYPEQQTWHTQPAISGGGHFFDLASHQFDYLDFLFGPIAEVHGTAVNRAGYYEAEDTVTATFRFASGVAGHGSWCFVGPKDAEEDLIEITGTEGRIRFSCFRQGEVELTRADRTSRFTFANPENISHHLVEQVVQALRGEGACVSTGESAARTSRVLDQITAGYYHNIR
ncbi:MAG: Gfo/Idh/MocA family oxidoreductase [Marinilabiliales bacterium]|nr:Gfo/Idh/MocA family oxidoreductase [Marinilabiliales bacterium]